MWRGLLVFVWMIAFVCDVVCLCVVFGNLNVCRFVLSLIYGVGCSVVYVYLCVFVCECFCRLNVCLSCS